MNCSKCKKPIGPQGRNQDDECWKCFNPRPEYDDASFWEIPRAYRFGLATS